MKHTPIQRHWSYRVRQNGPAKGWREVVADKLRNLASRIDHRYTLAVEMKSNPVLPMEVKADCIKVGFQHTERLFAEEVRLAAVEDGYMDALPWMFNEEKS